MLPDREDFEQWAKVIVIGWFILCTLIVIAVGIAAIHFVVKFW